MGGVTTTHEAGIDLLAEKAGEYLPCGSFGFVDACRP
jgi:hypothetical protein